MAMVVYSVESSATMSLVSLCLPTSYTTTLQYRMTATYEL